MTGAKKTSLLQHVEAITLANSFATLTCAQSVSAAKTATSLQYSLVTHTQIWGLIQQPYATDALARSLNNHYSQDTLGAYRAVTMFAATVSLSLQCDSSCLIG